MSIDNAVINTAQKKSIKLINKKWKQKMKYQKMEMKKIKVKKKYWHNRN